MPLAAPSATTSARCSARELMSHLPISRLLEALVYAPVGLAVQLRDDVPALVAKGRAEVENRIRVARWVGEMTVQYGKQAIEQRLAPHSPQPVASEAPAAPPAAPVPAEPFHGYAALSAAEIVPMLAQVPHAELHLVRDYEAATRARRTVLARVDALLGA